MNERIKKLVVKANGYWEYGDHNMPSTVCFKEADLEKFAELIVAEARLRRSGYCITKKIHG